MLSAILSRIDRRLTALGLTESAAAKKAGLSDSAIRNMRRAVRSGKDQQGASTRTLGKLAPALGTTVSWLMTGEGEEVRRRSSLDRMLDELPPELADEIHDDVERRIATTRRLLEERSRN